MENQDAFNAWYDNEIYSGRDPGRCSGMCYTIQSVQPERIAALEEMLKRNGFITTIEPEEAHYIIPGWISVKDRFPNEDGRFLVYEPNIGVYIAFVTKQNGDYFWWASSLMPRNAVTHWMPLPEPPKS